MSDPLAPGAWSLRQLTRGTGEGRFHQHSYYDIPVFDDESRRIAVFRSTFAGRDVTPADRVTVGYVDIADGDRFVEVGESGAFSLQQGPMAQWVPGRRALVWNDREGDAFVARLHDLDRGETRALPAMIYALAPDGRTGLSLNMARLDGLRPGYGYAGGTNARIDLAAPADDGVWRVDLETGERRLILSLADARRVVFRSLGLRERLRHLVGRYRYWFNHAKVAPDGRRFTVKFRWRRPGGRWNDAMGVSLTAGIDGSDPAVLARGTSHVIWEDPQTLFFYSSVYDGNGVLRVRDEGGGRILGRIAPDLLRDNVHMRALPGRPGLFVYDTPYRRDIDLALYDERSGRHAGLATFTGHEPARGPYRCDLHPCPAPDGRHVVVTSLQDGGRQVYLLSLAGEA